MFTMYKVCVLNQEGDPLMPCHPARARQLIRSKKAVVVSKRPFTIQLLQPCDNVVQPVTLAIDPTGSRHADFSVSTEKEEFLSGELKLRQDTPDRQRHRKNRRYRKPRRTDNRARTRDEGGLTPTQRHNVDSMLRLVNKVTRFLPVQTLAVEDSSFDVQKLRNPHISAKEAQESDRIAQENARGAALKPDSDTCRHCGETSEENNVSEAGSTAQCAPTQGKK